MKKLVLLVFLALLLLVLSACADSKPEQVPLSQISFKTEENPSYIGSYYLTRTNELNAKWDEYGEWTPFDFSSREVCFGMFRSDDYGVFRSRSDYHWVEDGGCLKLEKRK